MVFQNITWKTITLLKQYIEFAKNMILNIMKILRKCNDCPTYDMEIYEIRQSVTSSLKDSEMWF